MGVVQPVQFGKLVLREKSIAQEYGRYETTLKAAVEGHHTGWVPLPPDNSYGHMPYAEANAADLEPVYPGSPYRLHHKAAASFREMAAAAAKDGITITPISAFRTRDRQQALFYGEAKKRGITLAERARVCAPPGYSEHHTGYTLDLKGTAPGTTLEETFETTPAFAWMLNNAHRFGWVLSFPRGNAQGVMYEPWHWRWEGDATSRKTFEAARRFNDTQADVRESGASFVKTMRTMRKVNAHAIEQLEKAGFDVVISGEGRWLKDDPQAVYYDHYEPALTVALVRRDNRELLATHLETIENLKETTAGPYKLLSTMLAYAWSVVGVDSGSDTFTKVSANGKPSGTKS